MDSMRSLNSSLPSSRSHPSAPPALLQAFRTAALSVTNLYKSAAADQANARQAGYQDALEDLLKFLDDENLGVQDGEGWRIRQWATQRYDGGSYHQHSEADDESDPDTKQTMVSKVRDDARAGDENKDNMTDTGAEAEPELSDINSSQQPVFRFTANHSAEGGMQAETSSSSQPVEDQTSVSPAVRAEVHNRTRVMPKSSTGRHSNRNHAREFTFTAGTKRKLNFPDFFDISNVPDRRDGIGGSKRGRLV